MRLIDADALKIPSTSVDMFENCRNCRLLDEEQVREIIDNAPTIDAVEVVHGEWIPCSERLPSNFSEDETVLATTDVDGDRVIPMFAFDVKSFYLKGYISAWMPLPEPWKGADDES